MPSDAAQHEVLEGSVARSSGGPTADATGDEMAVVRAHPWLRPGDLSAVARGADEALPVAAASLEEAPPPATARDVAETAMRAVAEIDASIASLQAMRAQLLAGIGRVAVDDAVAEGLDPGVGVRDVACELALLTRRSDRTVEADLSHAMTDVASWPATIRAWGAARIHRGHLAVIAEVGAPLQDPAARAAFEEALLPRAERMNPGRLRAWARREFEQHLQRPLAERHRDARSRRGVFLHPLDDGMSKLEVIGPTVLLTGAFDRLTQLAKATRRATEAARRAARASGEATAGASDDGSAGARSAGARSAGARSAGADSSEDGADLTFDQLRADLLCDLLLTGDPTGDALAGVTARIELLVPPQLTLGTLLAAAALDTDEPPPRSGEVAIARLSSGEAVDPETARVLMERAERWLRVFTDPVTGQVLATDAYAIPDKLKRLLRARDQRCRWPGCSQRAARCDIDHTQPWAEGGRTEHGNLAHLCRRHHTLKGAQLSGARRWKVRQTSPGVLEFTSPMGMSYLDEPTRIGPVFTEPAGGAWDSPRAPTAPEEPPF